MGRTLSTPTGKPVGGLCTAPLHGAFKGGAPPLHEPRVCVKVHAFRHRLVAKTFDVRAPRLAYQRPKSSTSSTWIVSTK